MERSDKERFLKKVRKGKEGECWHWTGSKGGLDGYGQFRIEGKRVGAHRVSYTLFVSEIAPSSLLVLHECDTPSCVNPDHLFLGTNADNARDRADKGRSAAGARHWGAKLTQEQVAEVLADTRSQTQIAADYGVNQSQISRIKSGKRWNSKKGT